MASRNVESRPYSNAAVDTAVQGITTSLNEAELALVVARVIDDHYWASFTHDWLEERGRTFALSEGERFPVGEMRLMGGVSHSSRPYRLALPDGELPHVRRRSADNIEVEVQGAYAAILDGLVGKTPLAVAAALINDTWDDLAAPPDPIVPKDSGAQGARIGTLLSQARK